MSALIGNQLEEVGWRQGSIVKTSDIERLLNAANIPYTLGLVLITASQSCDIANNNIDAEPFIELSLARCIDTPKPQLCYNKNPRILHTHIVCRTGDEDVFSIIHIELKAFERITIPKEMMKGVTPDQDRLLEDRQLISYVEWLAARYSRPALPTAFNDRIKAADPKDKLRDKAKKGNELLVGIYVEIMPDAEIHEDESYNVNLLGLLSSNSQDDKNKAKNVIDAYANIMKAAGMNVFAAIRTEHEVSVATIRRFKRFYYDDLSLKKGAPMPPETDL